jgi:hypothetical protein
MSGNGRRYLDGDKKMTEDRRGNAAQEKCFGDARKRKVNPGHYVLMPARGDSLKA